MKKAGAVSGLSPSMQSVRLRLCFLLLRLLRGLRPIEKLDQRHRRIVALPESVLEDTQVPSVSLRVARAELGEELGHYAAVAQPVESEAPVGERRLLAEREDGLDDAPQLLRLGERGVYDLVPQERNGHIAQHRQAMAAGAVQLSQSVAVTHRSCRPLVTLEPSAGPRGFEAGGRPVLELHSQGEPPRGEYFLDLVERLAPEVGRLEKLGLGALDQIADVIDVLRLQAVGRANRKLQVVDGTQQNRIDLRSLLLLDGRSRAFERGEYRQLIDEDPRRVADRLLGLDHAVGFDVDDELVEVGTLLDPRRLHGIRDAPDGRERGVEYDLADALGFLRHDAQVTRKITAAAFDLDLHLQLAAGGKVRDDVLRIDDLDVVGGLDVACGDGTLALFLQVEQRVFAVVELQHDAF